MLDLADQLDSIMPTGLSGSVVQIVGMTASVADFPAPVGAVVEIEREASEPARAEVIGFRDDLTLLYPYENLQGVRRGNRVRLLRHFPLDHVGSELLGRVVDPKATPSMAAHRRR